MFQNLSPRKRQICYLFNLFNSFPWSPSHHPHTHVSTPNALRSFPHFQPKNWSLERQDEEEGQFWSGRAFMQFSTYALSKTRRPLWVFYKKKKKKLSMGKPSHLVSFYLTYKNVFCSFTRITVSHFRCTIAMSTHIAIVRELYVYSYMWELDHKEGWVLKNWCFQIVVLEKTLENLLDCKEINLVSLKGNQP